MSDWVIYRLTQSQPVMPIVARAETEAQANEAKVGILTPGNFVVEPCGCNASKIQYCEFHLDKMMIGD